MMCWLNQKGLKPGAKYLIRHTTNESKAIIKDIKYKIDINTLDKQNDSSELEMNDIGRVTIKTAKPLFVDSYRKNRNTGSIILVDEFTNETVGAGMIV